MTYSSKDFGRTPNAIRPELPTKLVHRGVERTSRDEPFSRASLETVRGAGYRLRPEP